MRLLLFIAGLTLAAADLRVFDGQGRELRDARVEEISATEVRVTAAGYAPVTVAKGATAVTLSRITVLATPGLAEEVMAPLGTLMVAGVGLWLVWRGVAGLRAQGGGRQGFKLNGV